MISHLLDIPEAQNPDYCPNVILPSGYASQEDYSLEGTNPVETSGIQPRNGEFL